MATTVIRFALMISDWKKNPFGNREKCSREELKAKTDKMAIEGSAEEQKGKREGGGWRKDGEAKQLCGFFPQQKTINLPERFENDHYDLKRSMDFHQVKQKTLICSLN